MEYSEEKLEKKAEEWKNLKRGTKEQREEAEIFYARQVLPLVEESFVARNKDKVPKPAEYMIYSVGTSFEPPVLSIRLFQPRKILFLYTEDTERHLDRIVEYCKLASSDYDKRQIKKDEVREIYREIKKAYSRWNQPEKLYVDITGGTKVMAAAVALTGSLLKAQIVYVDGAYMKEFHKPDPGSEVVAFVSNPLDEFCDLEIKEAFSLFREHNYSGACEKLQILKTQIRDWEIKAQLHYVYLLGKGYEAWDAFDFKSAYKNFKCLNGQLDKYREVYPGAWLMDLSDKLKEQEKILESMCAIPDFAKNRNEMGIFENRECMIFLMFSLYQNAVVREKQKKYDMATLLLYRLLEMVEQKRLSNYGLNTSAMVCDKIPEEICKVKKSMEKEKWLKEKMNLLNEELDEVPYTGVPRRIPLYDGFKVLYVIKDDIFADEKKPEILKDIKTKVRARNNSIFAHGFGPVSKKQFSGFKEFVEKIFQKFCWLENIDYDEMREKMVWLAPSESKNYSKED